MKFLKMHWGTIISIAGPLLAFLVPAFHAYASAHPKQLLGVIMAALVTLFNAPSPLQK